MIFDTSSWDIQNLHDKQKRIGGHEPAPSSREGHPIFSYRNARVRRHKKKKSSQVNAVHASKYHRVRYKKKKKKVKSKREKQVKEGGI